MQFPGLGEESSAVKQFKQTVFNATGIIIATPEYHGSFSAATKLAIENLGFPSAISGKPIALLGVAAGAIGAIKSLEQLRGVCSHIGAMVLPGPVSVPKIQSVFDDAGRCIDPAIENVSEVWAQL
jgi:FMN reductase